MWPLYTIGKSLLGAIVLGCPCLLLIEPCATLQYRSSFFVPDSLVLGQCCAELLEAGLQVSVKYSEVVTFRCRKTDGLLKQVLLGIDYCCPLCNFFSYPLKRVLLCILEWSWTRISSTSPVLRLQAYVITLDFLHIQIFCQLRNFYSRLIQESSTPL